MTNIWSAIHIDFTDILEMEVVLSFARESVDKNTIHQKIDSVFSFLYDFKSIILKTEQPDNKGRNCSWSIVLLGFKIEKLNGNIQIFQTSQTSQKWKWFSALRVSTSTKTQFIKKIDSVFSFLYDFKSIILKTEQPDNI